MKQDEYGLTRMSHRPEPDNYQEHNTHRRTFGRLARRQRGRVSGWVAVGEHCVLDRLKGRGLATGAFVDVMNTMLTPLCRDPRKSGIEWGDPAQRKAEWSMTNDPSIRR